MGPANIQSNHLNGGHGVAAFHTGVGVMGGAHHLDGGGGGGDVGGEESEFSFHFIFLFFI